MAILTFGESSDNAVVIEYADDGTGDAAIHWKERGGVRKTLLPTWVVRTVLQTVRAEAVLEVTSNLLDRAAATVTETVQAVDRLSVHLSVPPEKGPDDD